MSMTAGRSAAPYRTLLVRKLAAAEQVDLDSLAGTGVSGRIRRADVLAAASAGAATGRVSPGFLMREATVRLTDADALALVRARAAATSLSLTVLGATLAGPQVDLRPVSRDGAVLVVGRADSRVIAIGQTIAVVPRASLSLSYGPRWPGDPAALLDAVVGVLED